MVLYSVLEGSSSKITMYIVDAADVPIAASDLTTATMTLYDRDTLTVINNRQDVDILNTGPGTIDSAGKVVISLVAADNAIIGVNRTEDHVLTFSFLTGSSTARAEVPFTVTRIDYV